MIQRATYPRIRKLRLVWYTSAMQRLLASRNHRSRIAKSRRSCSVLRAVILGAVTLGPSLGVAQNTAVPPAPKTTDQTFKNISVLKGIPADQLIPSMQFISASIGVECSYCHVEGSFDKDDKKAKVTARKMMEMMFAINKERFEGHREVTCYSCHRGSPHPVSIPVISADVTTAPHSDSVKVSIATNSEIQVDKSDAKTADSDAAAPAILNKWVAALGGATAIQKVTSRIEKGSVDLGGRQMPIDIYAQAPDKRLSAMHLPNGDSITAYNGTAGWLTVPGRPTQWMSPAETDVSRLDAELYLPLRINEIFSEFRVLPTEIIDGHEVSVVQGLRAGKPPVNFYFERQSGLLVRLVRYVDTPLGLNPTQIDYADYRDENSVKIPYRWTIARPSGRFTIQIERVQQNVAIPPDKFTQPAP